ncbi:reverse transcriptase domain-containing protein [Tanacetum coccineum]|uniref:Reverse transcriptase domain-containing protein n=1 Tax=Tanacetum coccineum TaxID=301880 RepID=A0ABQ4WLD5_9ASTR
MHSSSPRDAPPLVDCLALADLGESINLMPLSVWEKLSLPKLTPTQMILELADRSTTQPAGIAKDVFVKVGKMARALIDVYGEELTLRVDDEAITFKVGQTSRYSYNNSESVNRIDVIDVSCEEYAQEVLGFSDISKSGNPTPFLDPILSTSFPSLTPFEGGDFILEEIEACLTNDSSPPGIDDADFDPEGDLLLLEKLLNNDLSSPLPPKELHFEEIKTIKSSMMIKESSSRFTLMVANGKTKHFQPIHYASKTMIDSQAHYTITEKELLAVVYAFEKFWPYLVLSKTIVYTDHSALKYLLAKQDAKPRLLRWILLLQEFDTAGDHRKVRMIELNELRDLAYEYSLVYKEKSKKIHESKIKKASLLRWVIEFFSAILVFKILSGKLKTVGSGGHVLLSFLMAPR